MMKTRITAIFIFLICLSGCEYFVSDVATRIRYALLRENAVLHASSELSRTFSIRPDHWPDACPGDQGYTLTLVPYRGGKQVKVGDIFINCKHEPQKYYTGLGSESIYVTAEMSIAKKPDEDLLITLTKTPQGTEITGLK